MYISEPISLYSLRHLDADYQQYFVNSITVGMLKIENYYRSRESYSTLAINHRVGEIDFFR